MQMNFVGFVNNNNTKLNKLRNITFVIFQCENFYLRNIVKLQY